MILALDSVFEQCSVACVDRQGNIVAENTLLGNRLQTQQILPMIQALLADVSLKMSDLAAIAFDRGPGAFSGIRINTAVAQAIAFAHDLPCLPVSSLQAVAQASYHIHQLEHVNAVIDARMNQVYIGEFILKDGIMQPAHRDTEHLLDYDKQTDNSFPLVGHGANLLNLLPTQVIFDKVIPSATIIGQLGLSMLNKGYSVPAEQALPVYLRHNAWKTVAEQQK